MELFKLFGTIAIENGAANSAIDDTTKKGGEADAKLGDMIGTAAKWAAAITAAAIAAGAAVLGFAKSVASTTDNIDKMSQKIGISREAYQELDFICSQSGTSVDTLQTGLKTLTSQMQAASDGTESATTMFDKLGVSVYDSSGQLKDQETMLWETLTALQGMENQTEKAALATDLFGRSGTELMPLLNGATGSIEEMREMAHELGLVIDDETIDAGVQLTDTMDQAKRAFSAVATSVGAELLPIVQSAFELLLAKLPEITAQIQAAVEWVKNAVTWTKEHEAAVTVIAIALGTLTAAIVAYNIAQNATAIITGIVTAATAAFGAVMAFVTAPITLVILAIGALIAIIVLLVKHWDELKEKAAEIAAAIKEKWEEIKSAISEKITAIVSTVKSKFEEIKTNIQTKIAEAKQAVVDKFTEIKDNIKNSVTEAWQTVSDKFTAIKEGITEKIEAAKEGVRKAIDKIKSFFDFDWELPKIKLPHFSITGKFSLNPPSIPTIGVEWFKKAMDDPMLMTQPTAFGVNSSGQVMAGGEAGSEVVSGTDTLMAMIAAAVASQNTGIVDVLDNILAAILAMDDNMGGNLRKALDGTALSINNREFGRLVRGVL